MATNNRIQQYEKFAGTLSPIMPPGDYLQVRTLDSRETCNDSLWNIWDALHREAQLLSAHNAALQPEITRDLVEAALVGIDRSLSNVSLNVVTHASTILTATYGGPHGYRYEPYPVRWAGESRHAFSMVMPYVNALFQIPQVPSNRLDRGILSKHAAIILRPLFFSKLEIMRKWFGLEIKGEISPDELDAIFRDANLRTPLNRSLDTRADTRADLAARDAAAMGLESAPIPTAEVLEQVQNGTDVWTFKPSEQHWLTFGAIVERTELAGAMQPPAEPFPFSETVVAAARPAAPATPAPVTGVGAGGRTVQG
jgi:hypothetical protein